MNKLSASSDSSLYVNEADFLECKETLAPSSHISLYRLEISYISFFAKISFIQSSNSLLQFKKIEITKNKSRALKLICTEINKGNEIIYEKPSSIRESLRTLKSSGLFSQKQLKFLNLEEISPPEIMIESLMNLSELHKKIIDFDEMLPRNYITNYERIIHNPVSWEFDYASFDKGIELLVTKINFVDSFENNKALLEDIQRIVLYLSQSVMENSKRINNEIETKIVHLSKESEKTDELNQKITMYRQKSSDFNFLFRSFLSEIKKILKTTDPSGEKFKAFLEKFQVISVSTEESKTSA